MDIAKKFNIKPENKSSHETDLYILPESEQQRKEIYEFLTQQGISFCVSYSNVEGQSWYGKRFFDIPFFA